MLMQDVPLALYSNCHDPRFQDLQSEALHHFPPDLKRGFRACVTRTPRSVERFRGFAATTRSSRLILSLHM
jgi:hypothetical protein